MNASIPTVAVVGRQNVGKSTLVNRLLGRREAIAHQQPGVTRDRLEAVAEWRGRRFLVVDTGGFVALARGVDALVAEQAERAERSAALVLLVGDAQTGVQEEDLALARRLRRAQVPVLVVVNKVDSVEGEADVAAFHALGLGGPVGVSALHGRGAGELLDAVVDLLPMPGEPQPELEGVEPRFAVVGRPNVGKSSLFNRLVGEERSVVYEEAGTTRDAVDAVVRWDVGVVRFVDTAGLRRAGRLHGVEYYGLVRATRAIDRAHVALLVVDASEGLTSEDKHIAARVIEAGRGLAVAANKWDLLDRETREVLLKDVNEAMGPFAAPPVVRTSALRGSGVSKLPRLLLDLHSRWTLRIPTVRVNAVLEEAQTLRPPPGGSSRYRYGTQVATGPPSFVLFGGRVPDPSYRRFLENQLRRAMEARGVPIRLRFRPRQPKRRGRSRSASA